MATRKKIPIKTYDWGVKLQTTCATCIGLNRKKGSWQKEKTCSELGHLPNSKSCAKYDPDHTIAHNEADSSMHIFQAIAQASPALREFIAHQLICANRITYQARNYEFMQRLYLRWQGRGSYISNYARCYLLDANANYLILIGDKGRTVYTIEKGMARDKLLTVSQFRPLREKMVAKGRIFDPSLSNPHRRAIASDAEEIPTLDSVATHEKRLSADLLQQADIDTLLNDLASNGNASRTYDSLLNEKAMDKAAEKHGRRRVKKEDLREARQQVEALYEEDEQESATTYSFGGGY